MPKRSMGRRPVLPVLLAGLLLTAAGAAGQEQAAPATGAGATSLPGLGTSPPGGGTLAPLAPMAPTGPTAPMPELRRAAPAQARTRTKKLTRTLTVDGRTVAIEGHGMSLTVRPGDGDRASVEATLEYWSDDEAWMQTVADSYDLEIRERSGRLEIDFGRMPEQRRGGFLKRLFGGDSYSWSLEVAVLVPRGTTMEVDNRYGPVDVQDVAGDLKVVNASGRVTAAGASATHIENTYAPVSVTDAAGPVSVRAGSGAVDISNVAAGVEASTSYANLRITDVAGSVTAEATSGGLEIRDVVGDVRSRNSYARALIEDVGGELDHQTSSGAVEVRDVGGRVRVAGSYGSMTLERVGAVEARNSSGSVTLMVADGDVIVSNSYAPVRIRDVAGSVRVDSSSAGVEVDNAAGGVDVTTSYDGVQLRGVGGAVRVRNGSGRVSVEGFRDAALTATHDIETSYAGIEVVWPAGVDVAIDAQSTYAGIDSAISGAVEASGSRHTLRRDAPGAARLLLVTSSGTIRIRER